MVEAEWKTDMKIVIDARESGTSTGRYVDKLVEYLHKLKPEFEIVILTESARLNFFREIASDFKVIKSDFKEFTFAEQTGLLKQIKKLRPDLVHFTMAQQPVRYKANKLTTVHDLTTIRFNNPSKNRAVFKVKQKVYKWVIKRAARDSRALITVSKFVKQDVAKFTGVNPRKIAVTYEAADRITSRPEPIGRLAGKQFIMYVGRPTPHKNLERLVEAFETLQKKYPALLLVLAGKTDANYKKIGELVTEKRLAHSVVFTDFISEGELRWLYENTAAYVFPSLSEGFGLPGLEAMAHGAPVVSSNATCLPEIYGDAAHYFDPLKPADIAAKLDEVLSSSSLRRQLIAKGQIQAAKYSWQTMAEKTLDIYKKALY
jgi:glycosyltransferase involved in cell wall biosynthesis